MLKRNSHKWLLVLLSSIVLLPLLHLFDSYTIPQKIRNLNRDMEILTLSYELSLDLSALISSTRAYILHSEGSYLDRFYTISNRALKRELDLYGRSGPGEKENINELIRRTKRYVSFVEQEVIPAVQAKNRENDVKTLLDRHQILSNELLKQANSAKALRKNKIEEDSSALVALEREKRTFSFILIVSSLILLITGTRKFLLPVLAQYSRLEELAARIRSAVIITNHKGYIKNVNKAAENLFKISPGRLKNKSLNEAVSLFPYIQNIVQPLFSVILDEKEIPGYQAFYARAGRKELLTIDYYPLFMDGKMTGAALIARPAEIHRDKRYLFEAIEAERKKISIEIHDWIGRNMSPIIHSLDYILNLGSKKLPEDIHSQLVQLRKHCQNAAADMRSIMNDIHPYLIDKVGLVSALESYIRHFEQTHGIKVYLFYQNRSLELIKTVEIVIYRIVQEALTNVVKHSNAGEVDIYFTLEDDTLKIEIVDNGDTPRETRPGKGLWGMKERANLVGGDLVYGFTDGGFAVTLTVPVTEEGKRNGEN